MTDAAKRKAAGWPAKFADVTGMRVRTKYELRNGWCIIPDGVMMTVRQNGIGWERMALVADACECCGVRPTINKVSWRLLEVVPA